MAILDKPALTHNFGFLVNDVARRFGGHFDRLSREQIGLSRAQFRLLWVLALREDEPPLSQAALAEHLDVSAMGVASLCDRMVAAGWVRREPHAQDKRINHIVLEPKARAALATGVRISAQLRDRAFSGLSPEESRQLLDLLGKARLNLQADTAP
jgi:DNA-binding MarR family transcriptional regulator